VCYRKRCQNTNRPGDIFAADAAQGLQNSSLWMWL
jgi:hypothetical protein